jgi:hypothetical protein
MTAPAYIKNTTTGDQIKVVKNLRGGTFNNGTTALGYSITSGVTTITMSGAHGFLVGDKVTIAGISSGNAGIPISGQRTITAATETTFSYVEDTVRIQSASITGGTVTLTFSALTPHGMVTNNIGYITNLGSPFDGTYTVTRVSDTVLTYLRTYSGDATAYEGSICLNKTYTVDGGTVGLTSADTLELDTYNTTVLYRGIPDSARSTLDVDIDWIKLVPGNNNILIQKSGGTPAETSIKYRSGWIG